MNIENTLNLTEAVEFVGKSKPTFYKLIEKYGIRERMKIGTIRLFDINDLKKLKKAIEK